ncbi:tetratricopeptide repeat protein [Terracidiphilus sp.]|uniref:tetratricopeptide repeat protein n=1 Tax=Terracidiphilus sp. TaxID=1964191 RepID=UPI003C1671A8
MDTQTRHALKQDKFAQATATGVSWVGEHRSSVVRWVTIAVVALVVVIGALVFWSVQTNAAENALGAAMDAYSAPLNMPGVPAQTGFYNTAAERSKAANQKFTDVARQYGYLPVGAKAHYFAGITFQELSQTGSAETELKTAAGAWDKNTANLAKLALAALYHQTGRDSQAIDLYNELIAKPSTTVTAPVAQLALADVYVAEGKKDQARALWAKIKDGDKDGMAGSLAGQKLAGQ